MIGSNPRERGAMYGYTQWLDSPNDENMSDSQQWKSRRKGVNWSRRWNQFAHIAVSHNEHEDSLHLYRSERSSRLPDAEKFARLLEGVHATMLRAIDARNAKLY